MNSFRSFLYRVNSRKNEYPENVVTFAQSVLNNPRSPGKDAGKHEWGNYMDGAQWDVMRLYRDAWSCYESEPPVEGIPPITGYEEAKDESIYRINLGGNLFDDDAPWPVDYPYHDVP